MIFFFVTDQIGFRIVEIDLVSEKIVRNIPTGRYPFGLALTPDESKLMVANVGMFEYKKFTDLDPADLKNTAECTAVISQCRDFMAGD